MTSALQSCSMLCTIATNGPARCTLCSIAVPSLICSLNARSVALQFTPRFAACSETYSSLVLCSLASLSRSCLFRNPPAISARRRPFRRRIFCRHPFALQGLHRAARHPALSVALPGASAAVAAPVRPRSSPTAGRRNLLGSGGPRCYLQDKYTNGGTRPGLSEECPCRAPWNPLVDSCQRCSGCRVAK